MSDKTEFHTHNDRRLASTQPKHKLKTLNVVQKTSLNCKTIYSIGKSFENSKKKSQFKHNVRVYIVG